MTLATVTGPAGGARIVLLKEFDGRGFVFYTNERSAKGRSWRRTRTRRSCSFGRCSNARCASTGGSSASMRRRMPISPAVRANRRSARPPRPKARRSQAAPGSMSASPHSMHAIAAPRSLGPRTGAAIASCLMPSSSGRAAFASARSYRLPAGRRLVADCAPRAVNGNFLRLPYPSRTLAALIALGVANHVVLSGSRVAVSLDALGQGASPAVVGVLMALFAFLPMCFGVPVGRLADGSGSAGRCSGAASDARSARRCLR